MDFKKCIVESGKKLENSGLTVETWGNISIRDPETGLVYLTPSAMKYSTIAEDDVVVCRLDGTIVEGHRKPTIETGLHLAVYRNREEVNAVIHTHPMYSMVYATQTPANVHSMHCPVLKNWRLSVKRHWERKQIPVFCIPMELSAWGRVWTQRLKWQPSWRQQPEFFT